MNKIQEIVNSWAISLFPNEEQKQIAQERLKVCMNCEFWGENKFGVFFCRQCGCATKAKVFSPRGVEACPLKKWHI